MIVSIQTFEHQKYSDVMLQMFQARKRVFFDTLHWDVSVQEECERDQYDDMDPVYLVWCDQRRSRHYGSMRLMPTTGPTLLYDVFRCTFPDTANLVAPGIWEGTRMCLDEQALAADYPQIPPGRAFSLLLVALCEFALDHGIHTLVSNYEPHVKRLYHRAGARVHELGRAEGFGRSAVCCGAFEVSLDVLRTMRAKLGLSEAIYRRPRKASVAVSTFCAA
ncbi:N-acyl-L-homoserine lactone (AHL) synthase (plasmid) [Devosia neptuniae]|uniref:Acyl-homoserine-lactone synthase n=1 Tax=Devosia neptuniae TaxID=191302 RepID=A0ABY6C6N2_9HYPH|nr:acyl-homoserine-lactone synthase [Devosia neptuniae]UXN67914.1 N-acyl-L-homoserine lactone (AHL) synthase [Devosia neptuniae]